jgi:hypothetical protein
MSSSDLIRWGAISFILGGAARIALSLTFLALGPRAVTGYFVPAIYILAVLFLIGGLVGLHTLQKRNYGRIGQAGFYTIILSFGVQILATVVFLFGSEALEWLSFPVGLLGAIVGFALYGTATLRAGVLPRWYGVLLIVLLPVSVALGPFGNIWNGLVHLVLGYVLWTRRITATEQPSRVS